MSSRTFGRSIRSRSSNNLPRLAEYIERTEATVNDYLQLRQDGNVARWACEFVHADAEPRSAADGLTPPFHLERPPDGSTGFTAVLEHLQITVNPAQGSVRRGDDWYHPLSVRTVPAAQFHRFDEWDELRRAAHALIDEVLTEMESQYRDYYPKGQNPSTRDRWETDADQFAAYVFSGRRPMDSRDDKRLERFAKMVGVDYPLDKKNRTT